MDIKNIIRRKQKKGVRKNTRRKKEESTVKKIKVWGAGEKHFFA
jgi:hypothetical protein